MLKEYLENLLCDTSLFDLEITDQTLHRIFEPIPEEIKEDLY